MSRTLLVTILCSLAGCSLGSATESPNGDALADPEGLREHDSPIQEIGEIGVSRTEQIKAHAWTITLGMTERVSVYTAIYSGESGPVIDTVVSLFKKGEDGWGEPIATNDDATPGSGFSRIDMELAPGDYRIVFDATKSTVLGLFGANVRCADGVCEYWAPNPDEDPPEEPGTGEADEPAEGAVSFHAPIVDDEGDLLSRFNDDLAAAGLPTFPDSVTVSSESEDPGAEWQKLYDQAAQDDVAAVIEVEMMAYSDPPSLPGLCYEGEGSALASFLWQFSDSIFSDQFVVYGWRAGGRSAYDEWHEPTSQSPSYEEWQAFDPSQGDVLVIFSTDDDGNEQTATVSPCAAEAAAD